MKPLKNITQYYVNLLVKLGVARFSILLALALISFSVFVQTGATLFYTGRIDNVVVIRSFSFGILITPWFIYFLSIVVEQLERSRQRLGNLVLKLREMRVKDLELHAELQENIKMLNQQIIERELAEAARENAIVNLKIEVSERKQAQGELAKRTALMRSFFNSSPDIIHYTAVDGTLLGCNHAFEVLSGQTESELIGISTDELYDEEETRKLIQLTDQTVVEELRELIFDIWLNYPNGSRAYFEFRKLPLYDESGQLLGLIGFGRDITERKAYQDAIEKASQDKTKFISTISHELRTPLNGIVGLSRILLDTQMTEKQRQYMQTINVSAITLGHIFNDVIDLNKYERSALELLPVNTDLQEFIDNIGNLSAVMAEQKGLSFELDILTDLPEVVQIDASRLRQVLWNLVSNAMKFTKEGSVNINISTTFDDSFAEIEFEVEDTGIGIAESELENIFALYYQIKSGKDNLHAVGTGIGLAVSQEIIHLMDGEVSATSDEGFGSTFRVVIKVPVVSRDVLPVPPTRSQLSLHIFMVEDIELNVTVARSVLEKLGHTVEVAMSGEEALLAFKPNKFDLILLDIQLPDMTGFDVLKELQQRYDNLPPVAALTANVIKDKAPYLQAGMCDALSKPLSVKAVFKVIENCTKDRVLMKEPSSLPQPLDKKSPPSKMTMDTDLEDIVDFEMLSSYIDLVGVAPVLDSVEMFAKAMPEYMKDLEAFLQDQDKENVVSEAHKIKGAAGSVGLKRIQQIAKKAQSPDLPEWDQMITQWVAEINKLYQADIYSVKEWVAKQE